MHFVSCLCSSWPTQLVSFNTNTSILSLPFHFQLQHHHSFTGYLDHVYKGICSRVSINTFNQSPDQNLDWYSVGTLPTPRLTANQFLIDTYESVDTRLTIDQLLIKNWLNVDQVSIRMSIEYQSRCRLRYQSTLDCRCLYLTHDLTIWILVLRNWLVVIPTCTFLTCFNGISGEICWVMICILYFGEL